MSGFNLKELLLDKFKRPIPQLWDDEKQEFVPYTPAIASSGGTGSGSSGGTSSASTYVAKEPFSGSANMTKTFSTPMSGFVISNDGNADLTFTIGTDTYTVKPSEVFEALFDDFTQVTINSTVAFRAYGKKSNAVAAPDTTAPNNVTGLTTSNITTTGLTLSWTVSSSTDTTGYEVYRGTTLLATVTGTTYNATSLSASTSYTFTVKAKDGSNNISTGTSVTVSTATPDITPPSEVTNLATSNITSTSLTLSWTASASSDIASYEVYNETTLLSTVTGTTYNVSGLSAQTAYTFKVKSKDTSNNVSTGVTINETTSNVADTTAPNNVTNLTTSNLSDVSVSLSWTASTSSDVVGYDIYKNGTLLTSTANSSYTVTGLTEKTQYTFSVRAKDGANNVATGTEVTITTLDLTAPNNATNLASSNITQTGVTLTWTASTSTDVANYQIYNGTTNIGQASGTTFEISGLTAGTQYNFVVKTKDASANESSGTSINVTTTSVDATAPTLTITPAATFTTSQTVTMSANETATIYYTLDGSTPTISSSVYSAALTLSATTTVKAFAKDTVGNESAVQTVTYTKDTSTAGQYVTDQNKVFFNFDYANVNTSTNQIADLSGNGFNGDVSAYDSSKFVNGAIVNDFSTPTQLNSAGVGVGAISSNQTYPLTYEFYINIPYAPQGAGDHNLFSHWVVGTKGIRIFMKTDGRFYYNGYLSQPSGNFDFTSHYNKLIHLTVVFTSSQQKTYIDGVLVNTNSGTSANIVDSPLKLFGGLNNSCHIFRLYTKELTASEVSQNYNWCKDTLTIA